VHRGCGCRLFAGCRRLLLLVVPFFHPAPCSQFTCAPKISSVRRSFQKILLIWYYSTKIRLTLVTTNKSAVEFDIYRHPQEEGLHASYKTLIKVSCHLQHSFLQIGLYYVEGAYFNRHARSKFAGGWYNNNNNDALLSQT
jgi:hypothetical protein